MHRNDHKRSNLLAELSVSEGHVNDLTLRWLRQQPGVTANNLNDAWAEYNASQNAKKNMNNSWWSWLNPLTGFKNLADMWKAYWSN